MSKVSIFWHRRDLRLSDNAGLYHALKGPYPVQPVFIFDRHILDRLEDRSDRRVQFIHEQLTRLQQELYNIGEVSMRVYYGTPEQVWPQILSEFEVGAVYTNHDYEPYASQRDQLIAEYLLSEGIPFHSYKDQCIFEKDEVVKADGKPYTVFTPYSRKWKEKLNIGQTDFYVRAYPTEKYFSRFLRQPAAQPIPTLESMGFRAAPGAFPPSSLPEEIVRKYTENRNFPAIEGTTRLSVHLRFGTVSIREMARRGVELNDTWLNELIWRDFYMMILHHFPDVATENFNRKYDGIQWRNNPEEFAAWCEGRTGYPIVDAGMRELNATGFMHNRVRMVVASFLTKHLLIDWRWGEAYFAKKLLDFDLSANNGGWQWAAGTGTDAQPYFRVFNPSSQMEKFDPQLRYVRRWVPEFQSFSYPRPIVEHSMARERAIQTYKEALQGE